VAADVGTALAFAVLGAAGTEVLDATAKTNAAAANKRNAPALVDCSSSSGFGPDCLDFPQSLSARFPSWNYQPQLVEG